MEEEKKATVHYTLWTYACEHAKNAQTERWGEGEGMNERQRYCIERKKIEWIWRWWWSLLIAKKKDDEPIQLGVAYIITAFNNELFCEGKKIEALKDHFSLLSDSNGNGIFPAKRTSLLHTHTLHTHVHAHIHNEWHCQKIKNHGCILFGSYSLTDKYQEAVCLSFTQW